jgi:ribosome-binding factor A
MPTDNPRARRIAEQIRQELADILWREVKDPRVHGVTLTAVEVTRDLEHAKVWFTMLTGDQAEVEKALQHASGFLRTELAHRMRMRLVPKLRFQYDESVSRGAHLSELIDQAVEEDKRHHQDD